MSSQENRAADAAAPEPVAKHPEYTYTMMIFDGLCVSGASVVVPLLRDHYGLSYDLVGTLLALLSVGNLLSSLSAGSCRAASGSGRPPSSSPPVSFWVI